MKHKVKTLARLVTVGTEEAVGDTAEYGAVTAAHMEHLAASIQVSVIASVDPVETGEGSVGNIGEGGIVQAGLPWDLLGKLVLAADGDSKAEAEDQQGPGSSSHLSRLDF